MEEKNSSGEKIRISTQKLLGGIGVILTFLGVVYGIGILLSIVGNVLLIVSIYQISNMIRKPVIFDKFITGFVLSFITGFVLGIIASSFGLMSLMSVFMSSGFMHMHFAGGMFLGIIVPIILDYILFIAAAFFYKQAYDMLALAINHKLFSTAGSLIYVGAITIILLGLGAILLLIGWIMLAVAFFTAPEEVEVAG